MTTNNKAKFSFLSKLEELTRLSFILRYIRSYKKSIVERHKRLIHHFI